MMTHDRHGILLLTAFPTSEHSITWFETLRTILQQDLDKYDAAILNMSERITAYKRKLIADTAKKMQIEWGSKQTFDDIMFAIHDKNPDQAIYIHQRIRSMEEELNYFYQFKQTTVDVLNRLFSYQQRFFQHYMADQLQLIKELHEARRDARFWHESALRALEGDRFMTKLALDLINRQKS